MIIRCGKYIFALIGLLSLSPWVRSQEVKLSIPVNHSKAISHLIFSPDEKLFATASADHTIKIWDVNFGCLLYTIQESYGGITEIAFSHDGKKIVSSSRDHLVIVIDIASGKMINKFEHKDEVFDVVFSHDDKLVASASKDSTAIVWDAVSGEKLWTSGPQEAWVAEVKFSLDDKFIVTSSNSIKRWDLATGNLLGEIDDVTQVEPDTLINSSLEYGVGDYHSQNIYATVSDNGIKLWDKKNGNLLSDIGNDLVRNSNVQFINEGKNFIYQEEDDVVLWDCNTTSVKRYPNSSYFMSHSDEENEQKIVLNDFNTSQISILNSTMSKVPIIPNKGKNKVIAISPSGKLIAVNSDNKIDVYDSNTGRLKYKFSIKKASRRGLKFNLDESLLAVRSENSIDIWNLNTGKKTCSIQGLRKNIRTLEFSPDNRTFATIYTMNNTAEIWDIESGKLIITLEGHLKWAYSLDFSEDGNRLITSSRDGTVIEWNSKTGEKINHFKDHLDRVYSVKYCKEDSLIMSRSRDKTSKVWNSFTGELIHTLDGHDAFLSMINDNSNGEKIITSSADGSIIQWDAKTGKQIMRFFVFNKDSKKTLLLTADNYYKSSKSTASLLFYTKGLQVFPFSQFDLKYNRPDIVLNRLGYASDETINSYQRAYEKRLQKMGFTEEMLKADFHLPEVIIVNEDYLSNQTELDFVEIKLKSTDSKYPLDRINVWINNVPIYGVNGISLRSKITQDFDTTVQLQLNEGDNKIEVSVLNQAGAESYKETVYMNCRELAPEPNLYFVGIGVKDYADETMNLKFSDKDIRDMANLYSTSTSYGEIYVDTFLNASVTKSIIPQIRKRLESSTIHDQVIFMYSGHGILDDSLDYFLTTHDINFFNPKEKGIPYEAIDELLDNIPARKKLVLIDACNSGEVDKDEMEETNSGVTAEVVGGKGDMFKKYATKTNSFEMMQELFTDLRRGTGATVISSSSGKYFSFEDKKYQNGVYTYALKLGLEGAADANEDNEITVSELKDFLYSKVESLTNGKQNPTARQENLEYDYRVW